MDVARRQIVEEPSLVGRIKTRRNLFRFTHAQIQQSMRMGWDVIERAKSSSNSTSRFDGPLDWDFMYSLSGKNSSRPPVYEDHVPGLKSTVQVNSDDVFTSLKTESGAFDDLLGGFAKGSDRNGSEKDDKAGSDFDDLLAGLGRSRSPFSDSDSGSSRSNSKPRDAPFDLDFMYSGSGGNSSPSPIYAKPVYDDGVFDSVLGLKSTTNVNFDDDIASPKTESGAFDDLLGGFGKEGIREDLLGGFGKEGIRER